MSTSIGTLFISIYDGDTEKNILRSRVLDILKRKVGHIVLLVRGEKRLTYYKEQFEHDNVRVELLPPATTTMEDIWHHISWNSVPTYATYLRRRMRYENNPRIGKYVFESLCWHLAHFRIWRDILRRIYASSPDDYCVDLFKKYKPDVFFSPNMFSPDDNRLLRIAKRLRVRTVTTAKSWDVLTTKAFTRVLADKILVFNRFNAEEALALGDYREDQVVITGFPQFDVYVHGGLGMERDVFMVSMGLDTTRPYIFFSIPGDWKTPYTKDILIELDRRIEAGRFAKPIQVLAQFHPKYPSSCEGLDLKHIRIRRPGTFFGNQREKSIDMGISGSYAFTFSDKDVAELYDVVRHSEMCVNVESTLTLDAAAVGKPSILIAYDGDHPQSYWKSVARLYEREHYQKVVKIGAAPLVRSHDELEAAINAFLNDPGYLKKEREKLIEALLFKNDGRASERVAAAMTD